MYRRIATAAHVSSSSILAISFCASICEAECRKRSRAGQIRKWATTTKRGLISAAAAVMDGSQKRPRRASGSFCGRRSRCCHLYQNLWVRRHSKPTLRLHDMPCSATVQCFRVVDQEVVQCSCPLGQIFMCYYSFCCYIKLYQRSTWQIGSSSKPGITCIKA